MIIFIIHIEDVDYLMTLDNFDIFPKTTTIITS